MNYEVVWTPNAESDLAEAWLDAVDRSAVSRAAEAIDRALSRSPLAVGTAQTSSVDRIALARPIAVTFQVVEDDKRVIVQSVFLID